jgi:diaminopimelate decarboxylase
MKKETPFSLDQIRQLSASNPTPFYVYDEAGIRQTARELKLALSGLKDYRNFFAIKSLPNPEIMKVLADEGMGFDASSMAELELCVQVGAKPGDIMFTSNDTPKEDYVRALELGALINLDDISEIDFFDANKLDLPEVISFRYNPGSGRANSGNDIIGQPEEAKYGLTREQMIKAYEICQKRGSTRFALHTMIVSNELMRDAHLETMRTVFDLAVEVNQKLGIDFEYIDIGGGYGIPYKPDEKKLRHCWFGARYCAASRRDDYWQWPKADPYCQ